MRQPWRRHASRAARARRASRSSALQPREPVDRIEKKLPVVRVGDIHPDWLATVPSRRHHRCFTENDDTTFSVLESHRLSPTFCGCRRTKGDLDSRVASISCDARERRTIHCKRAESEEGRSFRCTHCLTGEGDDAVHPLNSARPSVIGCDAKRPFCRENSRRESSSVVASWLTGSNVMPPLNCTPSGAARFFTASPNGKWSVISRSDPPAAIHVTIVSTSGPENAGDVF